MIFLRNGSIVAAGKCLVYSFFFFFRKPMKSRGSKKFVCVYEINCVMLNRKRRIDASDSVILYRNALQSYSSSHLRWIIDFRSILIIGVNDLTDWRMGEEQATYQRAKPERCLEDLVSFVHCNQRDPRDVLVISEDREVNGSREMRREVHPIVHFIVGGPSCHWNWGPVDVLLYRKPKFLFLRLEFSIE